MEKTGNDQKKIGLALGSGSSRGWSHIGVIRELLAHGIEPDIVSGCSIGSIVAAAYTAGNLDNLESWVRSLGKRDVAGFFELKFSLNGLVDTEKLRKFLAEHVCAEAVQISHLDKVYGSVATNLNTGREVWFTEGGVLDSVIASIALPALFEPVYNSGNWLIDGGLVNPVPVSLCHAMGADSVIAVNLNGDLMGKHFPPEEEEEEGYFMNVLKAYSESFFPTVNKGPEPPGLFDCIASSVNIFQDRITRSRMAGDPPDILLNPRLAHIELLAFDRAGEAIEEGRACVQRMMPEIRHVLGLG